MTYVTIKGVHNYVNNRILEKILYFLIRPPCQARKKEEKLSVKNRKKSIQKLFREELSLIVDVPKVGHGNSNDGNTA